MIKDKDVKIAENPTEALWEKYKEMNEQEIKNLENALLIHYQQLKLAKKMLKDIKNDKT